MSGTTRRILAALILIVLLTPLAMLQAAEPERVGPPTLFMQDALRYMQRVPDEYHRQSYPIPATPVTRETYMAWIEESGLLELADTPKKGLVGPNELLPSCLSRHSALFCASCRQHRLQAHCKWEMSDNGASMGFRDRPAADAGQVATKR